MLDVLSSDRSYLDEEAGDASAAGWIARIGRFVIEENEFGFFSYQDFESEIAAEAHFATVEADYELAITETEYNL
jgi:hypothetical protein